ncbi:MAG: hypothetical protein MAG451_00534 [Anaerolineales bacterium]|nr:hypothetical protein [Anaerolineales bacterium]
MPLYAYECEACQHQFEAQQSFSDDAIEVCPCCGEPSARRLITSVGIIFKGPGFYVTDSRKALTNGRDGDSKASTKSEKTESKTTKAEK